MENSHLDFRVRARPIINAAMWLATQMPKDELANVKSIWKQSSVNEAFMRWGEK